jgi:hypothetical protein
MATDVDVQFFSHLNGLTLDNHWGDMIRLLDTCLVNGLPLTSINSASIDAQGDITLNLYAAHSCMLFQIIELTGFTPTDLNGKYRIKGVPSATQLILKANHAGKFITTTGSAKLASLGYEIIFRDTNDVKRVYRAKNPRAEHPFIRVDESLTSPDGITGIYTSSYVKGAMVGLIEDMTHIDDFEDPNKLQLPLTTDNFTKNWKIVGSGATVVRGWCKWYWAAGSSTWAKETETITAGNRNFTLIGNADAFYSLIASHTDNAVKKLNGCGIYNSSLDNSIVPNWFLMSTINDYQAQASNVNYQATGISPLCYSATSAKFFVPKYSPVARISNSVYANPIVPDYTPGYSGRYNANDTPALEVPLSDDNAFLRGTLKHVMYCGKNIRSYYTTTPWLSDSSMYVSDSIFCNGNTDTGAIYFYLGELE